MEKIGGLTAEKVIDAIRECKGNVSAVTKYLGCNSRQTVYNYINKHPSVKASLEDVRDTTTDKVEDKLIEKALDGEAWAVCFYLKCKAKDRGYVERSEFTGKDGGPVEQAVSIDFSGLSDEAIDKLVAVAERITGPQG